ncbi:MAG: SRPBCC domain-containing protein [bacterium]|nr:SRPBCC domain-containing protein [bacterium]
MRHVLSDRTIELDETIAAPLKQVWAAWTTTEGITSWLVQEAEIDLRIGGAYELYFAIEAPKGSRGAEGCKVLSYAPQRMLSFSWNAPPTIPKLRKLGPCTWVVLEFEALDPNKTAIRFRQFGIKVGKEWDEYLAYFESAWPNVLAALKKHFQS